jgi:hypothetical protein
LELGIELPSRAAAQETRKGKRSSVLFKATILSSEQEGEARIRDLSRLGALIEMEEPPALGEQVRFVRGSTIVAARIAWVGGNRAGIEFDKPVDERQLIAQPPSKSSILKPRLEPRGKHKRPGIHAGISPEELRLARLWAARMGLSFEA